MRKPIERGLAVLYYGILILFLADALRTWYQKSWDYIFQLIPALGQLSLPAWPITLIMWSVFGMNLPRKFSIVNSFLLLGFIYCLWDLGQVLILEMFSGIWLVPLEMILLAVTGLYLRKRISVNLNNWWTVLLFIQYVQQPEIRLIQDFYPTMIQTSVRIFQIFGDAITFLWVWYSFKPKRLD